MKKILLLFLIGLMLSCDSGSVNYNNPNIPNYQVNLQINMNLPGYTNLQFPGNRVLDYSQGARGIVVFNTGSGYNAFDLACPNQAFTICTEPMTVSPGNTNAECNCDDSFYSLYTGIGSGQQYPMKPYRVSINGNTLIITN
jgi:nitrite reductase/ring-hydroxylating ferredoxin subunit